MEQKCSALSGKGVDVLRTAIRTMLISTLSFYFFSLYAFTIIHLETRVTK